MLARVSLEPFGRRDRLAFLALAVWTAAATAYLAAVVSGFAGRAEGRLNVAVQVLGIPYQLMPALVIGALIMLHHARRSLRIPTLAGLVGWSSLVAVALAIIAFALLVLAGALPPIGVVVFPLVIVYEMAIAPAASVAAMVACVAIARHRRAAANRAQAGARSR